MDSNKMYDKIVNTYNIYNNYLNYVDKKKKDFISKKQDIAKKVLEAQDENLKDIAFEVLIEDKIHSNDINLIFNTLYTLVSAYAEFEEAILLPKEIKELCSKYESAVAKTMFVVNDSLICEERVKGSVDKVKDMLTSTGEMDNMVTQFKKIIEGIDSTE